MAYTVAQADANEITLVRRTWNPLMILLASAAVVSLAAAVYRAVSVELVRGLLPLGLAAVAAALYWLVRSNRSSVPKRLQFQPRAGTVVIESSGDDVVRVSLRDLIGVGIARRTRGRYALMLSFGDGSFWEVCHFAFRRSAARTQRRLEPILEGARSGDGTVRRIERLRGSAGFRESRKGQRFSWSETFSARTLFAANGLLVGIALVAAGLAAEEAIRLGSSGFLWGVYALLQAGGLGAAIGALFLWHAIDITPNGVEFRTRMRFARGNAEPRWEGRAAELTFPRGRLSAVNCSLEPDRGVQRLRLLTAEDGEAVSQLMGPDIGFLERFRLNRRLERAFRLPLFGLSFGQALELRAALLSRARS